MLDYLDFFVDSTIRITSRWCRRQMTAGRRSGPGMRRKD